MNEQEIKQKIEDYLYNNTRNSSTKRKKLTNEIFNLIRPELDKAIAQSRPVWQDKPTEPGLWLIYNPHKKSFEGPIYMSDKEIIHYKKRGPSLFRWLKIERPEPEQ